MVDFTGFKEAVDNVGGVSLNLDTKKVRPILQIARIIGNQTIERHIKTVLTTGLNQQILDRLTIFLVTDGDDFYRWKLRIMDIVKATPRRTRLSSKESPLVP
jgi:hypothetical protein